MVFFRQLISLLIIKFIHAKTAAILSIFHCLVFVDILSIIFSAGNRYIFVVILLNLEWKSTNLLMPVLQTKRLKIAVKSAVQVYIYLL